MGVEMYAHVGRIIELLNQLNNEEIALVIIKLSRTRTLPDDVLYHLTKAGHGLIHSSHPQYTSSEVVGKERQMIN